MLCEPTGACRSNLDEPYQRSKSSNHKLMTTGVTPHDNDVLFGRGVTISAHPGNKRLRSIIQAQKPAFLAAKRNEKRNVARGIVDEVENLDPPGRFLMEDPNFAGAGTRAAISDKVWICVENKEKAVDKVMHRLREKAGTSGSEGDATQEGLVFLDTQLLDELDADELAKDLGLGSSFASAFSLGSNSLGAHSLGSNSLGSGDDVKKQAGSSPPAIGCNSLLPPAKTQQPKELSKEEKERIKLREEERMKLREEEKSKWDSAFGIGKGDFPVTKTPMQCTMQSPGGESSIYTAGGWIKRAKSRVEYEAKIQSTDPVSEFIKMALPIASKLTDFLIEAEKDERIVPQSSIIAANVLIRAKEHYFMKGSTRGTMFQIEYVWIDTTSTGDMPYASAGGIMSQLFTLGIVLYELFAGVAPHELFTGGKGTSGDSPAFNSMNLNTEVNGDNFRRRKKSSFSQSEDSISKCISRLQLKGIPWSLCALVKNLLDCSKGDFCGDDAYASLVDLQSDLQLMIDYPTRFLDNIETSPLPQLVIGNKLYGREDEIAKMEFSYQQHIRGECRGIIVKGGAGVGKSRLAIDTLQKLTNQSNAYFLTAKFDQNKDLNPLSTVGSLFNSLCDLFALDASPDQLMSVQGALESALGAQAGLLAGAVPSLSKLMPLNSGLEASSICIDSALSMRFLFAELARVISSHSRPITLLLDDIQWADTATLLLVENLLSVVEGGSKSIFFAFCYRDDEVSDNGAFNAWLSSITMFPLEAIKLENMTAANVNILVSDALHLSPRITWPLSSVLHRKTGGNPLFLRQLMYSLNEKNHLRVQLSPPQWTWDLNKIMDLKISEDVVALMVAEMQRLPTDLRLGLEVASCFGSCVKYSILDILSTDLKANLQDALQQVSKWGLVDNADGKMFRFAHDKIEQAAYELMAEQKRRSNHMLFGLALCNHALSGGADDYELFFVAVNQMNRGGPEILTDPNQKTMVAQLNLKAGKRAIDLSDYNTAFQLFEHGISFLGNDHWVAHYDLSVNLFDAAAEAACVLNKSTEVKLYSEQLITTAKCFDDKLNCLYVGAKALRQASLFQESMDSTFNTLRLAGEELPRNVGDSKLSSDMQVTNDALQTTSDDYVLNMPQTNNKKIITLQKIYFNLADLLHLINPSLICAASLRMVELTLSEGLTPSSPLAFALYGEMLLQLGYISEGCRLGRLALKLCEKVSSAQKSCLIIIVNGFILWASEPLQLSANAHLLGRKCGRQSGDLLYATFNWYMFIATSYVTGESILKVQEKCQDFITEMQRRKYRVFLGYTILLHSQCLALKEGPSVLDAEAVDNIPTERDVVASAEFGKDKILVLTYKIHQLVRAFLFRQLGNVLLDIVNIWETILEEKHPLRHLLLIGIFFEGLASYQLARSSNERGKWMEKGETVLSKMKLWSQHSSWNWKNKTLLLEAEKMHTLGDFGSASSLYERSIRFARKHKFIHEEAIASELAGLFYHERGLHEKSLNFYLHSVWGYKKWGAVAVAKRVETFIASKFGTAVMQVVPSHDTFDCLFESSEDASKKRSSDDICNE